MLAFLPGQVAAASIIEVDDDADISWYDATHVHTIEEAVTVASDGDTILVHPGIYLGTASLSKRISLESTDGAASTIVRSTGTYGIRIMSDWVNVTGFTSELADYGIDAVTRNHCTVKDCVVRDSDVGIRFHSCDNSRLEGCNVTGSKDYGLYLYDCPGIIANDNWVYSNGLTANQYGGLLIYSNDARLERNRFFNNTGVGLRVYTNERVVLENNTFEDNGGIGLSMEVMTMTRMRNNTFAGNPHDLYILGNSLATFQQDIDTSNVVSSGPIYYYLSGSSFTVPSDAGMVGLVQCTNVTVEGLSVSNGGQAVILAHSTGCILEDIAVSDNYIGFELYYSHYNTIRRCQVNGSGNVGAYLYSSTYNLIADSDFTGAVVGVAGNGILADYSHNTRVERCNVSDNHYNGVIIRNSNHCHVNDSITQRNKHGGGVFAYLSNYMSVRGNNVSGNGYGILISQSSSHAVVADNQVFNNMEQSSKRGIEVYYSDLAEIVNNTVVGNYYGIYVYVSDHCLLRFNTVRDSQSFGGIHVYDGRTVIIENNTAVGNEIGIDLDNPGAAYYDYNNSVIANNTMLDSGKEGLKVDGRLKNATIAHNVIEGAGASYYGIRLSALTRDSLIYDNRIVCSWNAYDAGTDNTWNVSKMAGTNIMGGSWLGGNYFSNYTGVDADDDGIGDTPFAVAGPGGSQDLLPLMTDIVPPSEPQGLVAFLAPGQVTLSWSAPMDDGGSPITNYSIYRGPTPGSMTLLKKIGDITICVDDTAQGGEAYYYAVRAHNIAGEGAMSAQVWVLVIDAPSEPTVFNVAPGDGEVQLTWYPPTDDGGSAITNYTIYRGPSSDNLAILAVLGNVTSYLDESVSNGNAYYYAASASNSAGEGAMTPIVSCMPTWSEHHPTCAITSPSAQRVNSSDVSVAWTMSDLVSGIDFAEVKLDSGTWFFKDKATSHTFAGVADGTHNLSLRVFNNAGYNSSVSRTIIVDTVAPTDVMSGWRGSGGTFTIFVNFSEAMGVVQGTLNGNPLTMVVSGWNASAVTILAPGWYILNVTGSDLAGNTLVGWVGFGFTITPETIQVTGRVVDGDGEPVASATVVIDGVQATTGSDGMFTCSVTTGQHNIAISAAGWHGYSGQVTVDDGELGDFTLAPIEDGDGGGMDWTLIIVVIVVLAALLILLLLFWKRRKKDEEEGKRQG